MSHRLAPQYQFETLTGLVTRISGDCLFKLGSRHESGGAGLSMSLEDYALFADAMACGGVGKSGERILSSASIDLMRKNQLSDRLLEQFRKMGISRGIGYGLGAAVYTDSTAACTLVPDHSFYWGGAGGWQNLIDPKNRLSYVVAQHTVGSPKHLFNPHMLNALYGAMS